MATVPYSPPPPPERTRLRDTLEVALFGVTSIPMLAFVGARVLQNDSRAVRVLIPLGYRTRNHLGSMYFGALSCGADLAGGLALARIGRERDLVLNFAFKDFEARFLRRAEGDVVFECADVPAVERAVGEALASGQRVNLPVRVVATVPSRSGASPVATFTLTLSLRHVPGASRPLLQRLLGRIR